MIWKSKWSKILTNINKFIVHKYSFYFNIIKRNIISDYNQYMSSTIDPLLKKATNGKTWS